MLLSEALARYIAHLIECQWSDAHIRTEKDRLRRFVFGHSKTRTPVLQGRETRELTSITKGELARYFIALKVGRAEGTMSGYTTTHRNFWKFCKRQKWLPKNLAKGLRNWSADPQVRQPAPEEDVQVVIRCLREFVTRRDHHPYDVRDALLVSLSIDCGQRLGAMCDLNRLDVLNTLRYGRQAQNGRIGYLITVNVGKTGAANIEFFDETAELFRLWFKVNPHQNTEKVFVSIKTGEPLHRNSAAKAFVRVCKFAGVRPFRSHAIRKRNVSEIIEVIADAEVAQRYAGHSDMETTLRHYKDKRPVAVLNAAADLANQRRGDVVNEAEELAKLFGIRNPPK